MPACCRRDRPELAILRYTLTGASSGSGNNRIDNLLLQATPIPEPAHLGLIGSFACLFATRLYRRRRTPRPPGH